MVAIFLLEVIVSNVLLYAIAYLLDNNSTIIGM